MKKSASIVITVAVLVIALYAFRTVFAPKYEEIPLPYSSFIKEIKGHNVRQVIITDDLIKGETRNGDSFFTYTTNDPQLMNDLLGNDVIVKVIPPKEPNFLISILLSWFPMLLLIGVWIYFMRKQSRSGGSSGGMGKSKHRLLNESNTKITFADVAGCDEAKHDVIEIVDFLKDPTKFSKLGGKIPRGVLLVGPPGTGKAQPLDAKIKIPGGWTTMGNIKVGDVVATPDNKTAKVLGLYPQGEKEIYKVEFDDGSYTECCEDHLWEIYCKDWKHLPNRSKVMSLNELVRWKENTSYIPRVRLTEPLDNPKTELPLDPYLLGLYLGDGTSTTRSIGFSSKDDFILNQIKSKLINGYELVHKTFYDYQILIQSELRKTLRIGQGKNGSYLNYYTNVVYDLGLLGVKSDKKFIPEIYFNSSKEDRIALVQGLMDTDGTVDKNGSASFTTTSFELADGLKNLIWSLGGNCKITSSSCKSYTYRGESKQGKISYNLWMRLKDNSDLFKLPRKKKLAATLANQNKFFSRKIINVERVSIKPAQCILIDHPDHLYITDDYIVTHNTLLARAVAGEAGVSFFSISGSDFVEMFVGVGASRVRDMFEEARKQSPCIIFIDEIDAIGKARTQSIVGNDERDQTLNALLVEMDGFEASQGIIIVAATNRPEILDKALLRPGRFDRQVTVGLPDINGREQILKVHIKDVPIAKDVKLHDIARGTPGFSGAELANLVNEASILASKEDHNKIRMRHFEKAKDKILMGSERKTFAMSEDEKRLTAYHEAGHAVVGYLTPEHDPIYKVSIIPRGRALGITMFLPERDSVSISKRKLEGQIASLYGGRIAEEMIAGEDGITTGASNDIERATDLATKMVTEWGMSTNLQPIKYVETEGGYVGAGHSHLKQGLDEINNLIEKEIEDIIERNYSRAKNILKTNWDRVETMVTALMKYETIDTKKIEEIMK